MDDLVAEGILCQACGVTLENEDFPNSNPGFLRWCEGCAPKDLSEDQKCLVDGGFNVIGT